MADITIPEALLERHIANCNGSKTGATILLYRTLAGYSAKDLAEKSGMSGSTLRRLEQGQTVTPESVAAVEVGLGLERGSILKSYFAEQKLRIDQLPEHIFERVVEMLAEESVKAAAADDKAFPGSYTEVAVEEVTRALETASIEVTEDWASIEDPSEIYVQVQTRIEEADPMSKADIIGLVRATAAGSEQ